MPSCNPVGYVHSLESFGSVDGPGVRFVVFLQGCALRCKYCHNPETWAESGTEWTVDALFQRVWRYRNYWGKKGGITVSGGEPLRQMDFLTAFFELARSKGVHTALDTAGQPFRPEDPAYLARFDQLMAHTSLVILDLKEMDPERHRRLTGKDQHGFGDEGTPDGHARLLPARKRTGLAARDQRSGDERGTLFLVYHSCTPPKSQSVPSVTRRTRSTEDVRCTLWVIIRTVCR